MPEISVIIPTYRQQEELTRCLTALTNQTVNRVMFEVIVVDDASDYDFKSILQIPSIKQLNVKYFRFKEEMGAPVDRNKGIELSGGEIIAFTDGDCVPSKNWLEKGLSILKQDENIDLIQGPIRCSEAIVGLHSTPIYEEEQYKNVFGGKTANMFVRRIVIDKVGGFNPNFLVPGTRKSFHEDTEFLWRVEGKGFKVSFASDVVVYHPYRPYTIREGIRNSKRGMLNYLLFRQHPSKKRKYLLKYLFRPTKIMFPFAFYWYIRGMMFYGGKNNEDMWSV